MGQMHITQERGFLCSSGLLQIVYCTLGYLYEYFGQFWTQESCVICQSLLKLFVLIPFAKGFWHLEVALRNSTAFNNYSSYLSDYEHTQIQFYSYSRGIYWFKSYANLCLRSLAGHSSEPNRYCLMIQYQNVSQGLFISTR